MDIKTAGRTLDLFEAFSADPRPLRLSEIATALQAPVSSCHQLLRTLEHRGYLVALTLKSYYPTRRMLQHVQRIAAHDPLLALAQPHMEALRDACGESVLIAQLSGTQAVILDVLESSQSIRYSAKAGALRSLHCSGIGKCLVGELDAAARDRLLPKPPYARMSPATLTGKRELSADLEESRQRGWYVSHGETSQDLWAVAVPVRIAGSALALCVAGPASRMASQEAQHVKVLQRVARQMQSSLKEAA